MYTQGICRKYLDDWCMDYIQLWPPIAIGAARSRKIPSHHRCDQALGGCIAVLIGTTLAPRGSVVRIQPRLVCAASRTYKYKNHTGHCLVGGPGPPLWKMMEFVNWDDESNPRYGKIKPGNQTTHQWFSSQIWFKHTEELVFCWLQDSKQCPMSAHCTTSMLFFVGDILEAILMGIGRWTNINHWI